MTPDQLRALAELFARSSPAAHPSMTSPQYVVARCDDLMAQHLRTLADREEDRHAAAGITDENGLTFRCERCAEPAVVTIRFQSISAAAPAQAWPPDVRMCMRHALMEIRNEIESNHGVRVIPL